MHWPDIAALGVWRKLELYFVFLEPSLTDKQLQELAIEVDRVEKVFKALIDEQPLDFAFPFVKE